MLNAIANFLIDVKQNKLLFKKKSTLDTAFTSVYYRHSF